MSRLATATIVAGLLVLAGCGGETAAPPREAKRSNRLVDFTKKPPYVNALEIDPATRDFLLATNRGLFRIRRATDAVERVRGVVRDRAGVASPVGTFLEVTAVGGGEFVGSGHPDDPRAGLPAYLGFIRSRDGGRTWNVVSRLGEADLHQIVEAHGRLYGWDAVLSALLITGDGGRTFEENFTPPGLILDIAVDPADPKRVVAANDQQLFRSTDAGKRWRGIDSGEAFRLVWPAPDALYRASRGGRVERSRDGGTRWSPTGTVPGEPYKFKAVSAAELYLALSDGTIMRSDDAGTTWTPEFRP